jgi:transposase-like protein
VDDYVIIRRYTWAHEGEIAQSLLGASGIDARVFGGHVADPGMAGPAAVVLRVSERDYDEADEVLRAAEAADDDPSAEDTVRCPRCELEHCHFGRQQAREAVGMAFWHLIWHRLSSRERWHCHKCGHAWDDENEGPRIASRFAADDPRPTFVLMRHRGGMGVFLGLLIGFFGTIVFPYAMGLPLLAGAVIGLIIGRSITRPVCSTPSCRTRLLRGAESCPGCRKTIAGKVDSGPEHYVALAEVRRDFAALRAEES